MYLQLAKVWYWSRSDANCRSSLAQLQKTGNNLVSSISHKNYSVLIQIVVSSVVYHQRKDIK